MEENGAAKICDREGNPIPDSCAGQGKLLTWLYGSGIGQNALKVLTKPLVSNLVGAALDHPLSTAIIPFFVKKKQIATEDYYPEKHLSFNSFFTRLAKPSARPIDDAPEALISPCDAKLSVFPITEELHFTVKGTEYALPRFLGCKKLAEKFQGGWCMIFRLTPDDYHRYCFIDDADVGKTRYIEGILHTVNPASAQYVKVYHENTRTVTLLKTEHFGAVAQIEVGAMCVGKIVNHPHEKHVSRGKEKGYFAFGGSTVVLLLQKDAAEPDPQILRNTENGMETVVKYGSRIGTAAADSHV